MDEHFPGAETIRLVLDNNLSSHTPAALYATFAPELARQCLDRRLPDLATVRREVDAWTALRNQTHDTVDWRLRTIDAG